METKFNLREIIEGEKPWEVLLALQKTDKTLSTLFPELSRLDIQHKKFKNNFRHVLLVLKNCVETSSDVRLRYVAIFHDLGKYETRKQIGDKWTFHGHEDASAKMLRDLYNRYDLPLEHYDFVYRIVKHHGYSRSVFPKDTRNHAIRRFYKELVDGYSVSEAENHALLDAYIQFTKCDVTTHYYDKMWRLYREAEDFKTRIYALFETDKEEKWRPPIDGTTIMDMLGFKGKQVGLVLKDITDMIKSGQLAEDKKECIKYIKQKYGNN